MSDPPTREGLVQELQRLNDEIGETPTTADVNKCSEWSHWPYYKEFESWDHALEAAGIEPENEPVAPIKRVSKEELKEEIRRLDDALGREPSTRDMRNFGKFSSSTYERKFGTWNEALQEAGFEPRVEAVGERGWNREKDHYQGPWYEAREKALDRDSHQCVDCGISEEENQEKYGRNLDVHHRKSIDMFENPGMADRVDNLMTLCPECHAARHKRS